MYVQECNYALPYVPMCRRLSTFGSLRIKLFGLRSLPCASTTAILSICFHLGLHHWVTIIAISRQDDLQLVQASYNC